MTMRLSQYIITLLGLALTILTPEHVFCNNLSDGECAFQLMGTCIRSILDDHPDLPGGVAILRLNGQHKPSEQCRTKIEAVVTGLGTAIAPSSHPEASTLTASITDVRTVYEYIESGTYTRHTSVSVSITAQSPSGDILFAESTTATNRETVSGQQLEFNNDIGRFFTKTSRHIVSRESLAVKLVSLAAILSALAIFAFKD